MRTIDEGAIKAHADRRFRSEYDYALFEYWRSAKVLTWLDRLGVQLDALSPLRVLGRGYAVPMDDSGRVLKQRADFVKDQSFRLRVADGDVRGHQARDRQLALAGRAVLHPHRQADEEARDGNHREVPPSSGVDVHAVRLAGCAPQYAPPNDPAR